MSKLLGRNLPAALRSRIKGDSGTSDLVVPLTSVDDSGLPHPALLSLYELIVRNGDLYFFLSERSRSGSNLTRRRVAALLFVEPSGCFYLKGHARKVGSRLGQAIFRLDLAAVLEDFPTPDEGTAFLVSSARFQGDPESIERREELREEIMGFLDGNAE